MTTVITRRVRLRRWRADDVEPYAQVCADPEVMRYINHGSAMSRDEAAVQIDRFEAHWDDHGYGLWAVELLDDGAFVGFAGLSQPLFLPEVLPAVEVGWRFARRYWGGGLATETGTAALEFGFRARGLERIIGIVHTDNAASRRVMDKLGMTVERTTVHPRLAVPLVVYETSAAPSAAG